MKDLNYYLSVEAQQRSAPLIPLEVRSLLPYRALQFLLHVLFPNVLQFHERLVHGQVEPP